MSKSSARAGSPIAEPAEWFDAVVDARYGKGVRDEILADAERAFRTHFDDDKNRKAENVVWHDGPDGKKIPFLDGWISPEMGAWQGEFWGKYMLAGAEVAECRNDAELKRWLAGNAVRFVREFRQSDGYIGSYADRDFLGGPKDRRHGFAWNVWGRKYTMWALLEIAPRLRPARTCRCRSGHGRPADGAALGKRPFAPRNRDFRRNAKLQRVDRPGPAASRDRPPGTPRLRAEHRRRLGPRGRRDSESRG